MPIDPTTRRAPVWLLVLVAALLLPWSCAVNLWFAERALYRPLLRASGGLLHPALQVCVPTILVLVVSFRVAGLRMRDFGWRLSDLPRGLLATALLWLLVHAVALVALGGQPVWSDRLDGEPSSFVGSILGQMAGNALFEETVYRGFFLVQLVLLLRARGTGPRRSVWLAALLSAVVFAVPHVPKRIFDDEYDALGDALLDQARLLVSGMLFAWVYLRTQNLWWLVGAHGLGNEPAMVLEWDRTPPPDAAVVAWGLALTVLWPWLFGRVPEPDATRPRRTHRRRPP